MDLYKLISIEPLPFLAALWARSAKIATTAVFVSIALITSLLVEELVNRADDKSEDSSIDLPNVLSANLEQWRNHYYSIIKFIDKTNHYFGVILLIQTSIGFAVPIFEIYFPFYKILQTKEQYPIYDFAFIHTILRFLLIVVPSYLVSQQVFPSCINWFKK